MRILYICEEYPPGAHGGIGTMVQNLAREAVIQGHEVWVAGLYLPGYGQPDYENDQGVRVYRFRYGIEKIAGGSPIIMEVARHSGILHYYNQDALKKFFGFVSHLVQVHRIDIIEMQDWNTFFQTSRSVIRIPEPGAPLVVKFNGSYSYFCREAGRTWRKNVFDSERNLLLQADALCAVSQYTAGVTKKIFGIGKPVSILHNCMAIPEIKTVERHKARVIYTGTLSRKKGIHSLIRAWNLVTEKNPAASLAIYGKGNAGDLKKLIASSARGSVFFYGHVSREELFSRLAEATLAVFPSFSECFALAPMEAMASGCPVIYSSRASGKELIHDGVNGLLADPGNIKELASCILLLLSDRELQNRMGQAGRKHVLENFNIRRSVQDHIRFYESTISACKRSKKMRHG